MTTRSDPGTAFAAIMTRARGFWAYYRRYTDTAIHAAATAALTAFGLLIFIDPSFAWLAIASYLLPPTVLYAIGSDAGEDRPSDADRVDGTNRPAGNRTTVVDGGSNFGADPGTDSDGGNADDDADADHDGVDRDYDGPDLDYDGPDADGSDGDADGPDRDADGLDHDHDGPDRDADGIDSDVDADGPDLDRDG